MKIGKITFFIVLSILAIPLYVVLSYLAALPPKSNTSAELPLLVNKSRGKLSARFDRLRILGIGLSAMEYPCKPSREVYTLGRYTCKTDAATIYFSNDTKEIVNVWREVRLNQGVTFAEAVKAAKAFYGEPDKEEPDVFVMWGDEKVISLTMSNSTDIHWDEPAIHYRLTDSVGEDSAKADALKFLADVASAEHNKRLRDQKF